jgi:hypothetical protein
MWLMAASTARAHRRCPSIVAIDTTEGDPQMPQFRVSYGPSQRDDLIEADRYRTDGPWFVFIDRDGNELRRIRHNAVQAIGLASAKVGPSVA